MHGKAWYTSHVGMNNLHQSQSVHSVQSQSSPSPVREVDWTGPSSPGRWTGLWVQSTASDWTRTDPGLTVRGQSWTSPIGNPESRRSNKLWRKLSQNYRPEIK